MLLNESTFSTHARKCSNLPSRAVIAAEGEELCAGPNIFF